MFHMHLRSKNLSISALLLTKVLITIFVISSTSLEIWFKVHLCHLGASGSNSAFQTWATWQCNKLSNGIRRMIRLMDACKFLKQLRPTWLLCSPAMDKAKHAAAIFSLPQKHSDNYHCPFWAPVLPKNAGKPNLEINATCMSWIELHKCISTISYLARWHLVGLKCNSCSSFMAPYRRTSDSLEPLASPQEFWAMCDIPLVYTQIRESHSKHQTAVSAVIQVKACQTPVYHIFFYTVFYCDTNWQSQVSIEWRKESLWPRHSSHLTVPDPSRTSTECDLYWFMRFAWPYLQSTHPRSI